MRWRHEVNKWEVDEYKQWSEEQKYFSISHRNNLKPSLDNISDDKIPLVLTFHPFNYKVKDIISRNCQILKNDPEMLAVCADKSGDFSPFHYIVYVHPPPTYSFRASASFTDRL